MSDIEKKEQYTCNYCELKETCEYAWDSYNKYPTVEKAKTENCLGMK